MWVLAMATLCGAGSCASTSVAVQQVLEQCERLTSDERAELLAALGAQPAAQTVGVALAAWSEDPTRWRGSCGVNGAAPPPPRPSLVVPLAEGLGGHGVDGDPAVVGCPWCRRPLRAIAASQPSPSLASAPGGAAQYAYVTLLYGPRCHLYFLGALVLGFGLQRHAGPTPNGTKPALVLLHTSDVPQQYVTALAASGWLCQCVDYLSSVARALFHNWKRSRFIDVFTKFRALQLEAFDKILFLDLDMLVRAPPTGVPGLGGLFALSAPAAMKRGEPAPQHGERVAYSSIWGHPTRRATDGIPPHQQASGINAGTMLLRPDAAAYQQMEAEVREWYHPEHYATYMPEQEYLSRFYGTFECWTHIDCRFNYELDKVERIPHDWTQAHETMRRPGHDGAVVLHYSGTSVKPWEVLLAEQGSVGSFCVMKSAALRPHLAHLATEGSGGRLEGYADAPRLWGAMLE